MLLPHKETDSLGVADDQHGPIKRKRVDLPVCVEHRAFGVTK